MTIARNAIAFTPFAIAKYAKKRSCRLVQRAPAIHHPAGADELGELPESASTMEHTMRNFTAIVLPILFAASISGIMFTATLA
ncbi:hypothetical protein [Novosphingobium sp. Chol11]|uniref:hypothetical protein n=1 Tax=Novosphingobium sp. Chol11 TaxID=1385763 RepID=UPI0025FF7656|nr:hypothetical protein [Novosphingobium sp. Chol11]